MTQSTASTTSTATRAPRGHGGPNVSTTRRLSRLRRHGRLRKKVAGSPARPRLVVSRSARHIVAQVIDDIAGHTLAQASSMEAEVRDLTGDKKAKAVRVGELVASRAKAGGIDTVTFDRGGRRYHGRIAQLADAARDGGLAF